MSNNTNSAVSIDRWTLKSSDGAPETTLVGTIPAKGFYLLERTDDTTVPNILANHIYTGALSNKGEYLTLFDGPEQNRIS